MSVTNRLVYNPTDAATRAASSTLGAHVLAGSDGTPIDKESKNSLEWLCVSSALSDGSGTPITSTGGALDINIASADVSIDVDDDLANVAIENTTTAVSATAVNVVTAALAARKFLGVANEGNKSLYFGKTGVTAVNGFPLHPGMQQVWRIGDSVTPQIIGGSGAAAEDLRVIELS